MREKRKAYKTLLFFFLLNVFFLLDKTCALIPAYALQRYDVEKEAGDKFVHAYLHVDNVLMGGTGKSRELLKAMEYAKDHLKHDEFTETWSHFLEMECILPTLDLRTKIKTDIEMDWVQRFTDVCFKKFIFFHWNEINDSIEKRYSQVSKPEFLKGGQEKP